MDLLREHIPDLKIRVVNVVDLMALQPPASIRTDLPDEDFDVLLPPTSRSSSPFTAIRG